MKLTLGILVITLSGVLFMWGGKSTVATAGLSPTSGLEVSTPLVLGAGADAKSEVESTSGQGIRKELRTAEEASDTDAFEEPRTHGREVLVLGDPQGEAMDGAIVTFLAAQDFAPGRTVVTNEMLRSFLGDEGDPEAGLNQMGKKFRADAEGRLFLPPDPGLVMGRCGELWELSEIPRDGGQSFVLQLLPETTIRIRLLDNQLVPVGGVDAVQVHDPEIDLYLADDKGTAKGTGVVTFEHLGRKVKAARQGLFGRPGVGGTDYILFIVHQREAARYEIDPDELPTETVDLVLEPTGSLVIQLTGDSLAFPFNEPTTTDLLERGVEFGGVMDNVVNGYIGLRELDERGRVVYFNVGLGLTFHASVTLDNGESTYFVRGEGPVVPGEQAVIEVPLRTNYSILTMRVLGAQGAPLVGARLGIALKTRKGHKGFSDEVRTDGNGVVRVHVDHEDYVGSVRPVEVRLSTTIEGRPLKASSNWPDCGLPGEFNLGDVQLSAAPLIVTGHVLDSGGSPIPRARVSAGSFYTSKGRENFRGLTDASAKTGKDGAFSIYGFGASASIDLEVRRSGYLDHHVRAVPAGSSDVPVTLLTACSLAGRVVLGAGIPASSLYVTSTSVQGETGTIKGRRTRSRTSLLPDGSFSLLSLGPGVYSLEVKSSDVDLVLTRIDNLVVRQGEGCEDPRLLAIPIEGAKYFEFSFATSDGIPPAEGYLAVRGSQVSKTLEESTSHWIEGGAYSFVTLDDRVDVRASFPRFRGLELRSLTEGGHFVIQPRPKVEVQIAGGLPELPSGMTWGIELRTASGTAELEQGSHDGQLMDDAYAAWWVSESGAWDVLLLVETEGEKKGQIITQDLPAQGIQVAETGTQLFELKLPSADLDEAIRLLRAKIE